MWAGSNITIQNFMNPYVSKFLADVTLAVSPTFESASWSASGTGQRTSTTAETRRLESRRYKSPALSVKDFQTFCDYISVPTNAAIELIHLEAVNPLNRLPVQRAGSLWSTATTPLLPHPQSKGSTHSMFHFWVD